MANSTALHYTAEDVEHGVPALRELRKSLYERSNAAYSTGDNYMADYLVAVFAGVNDSVAYAEETTIADQFAGRFRDASAARLAADLEDSDLDPYTEPSADADWLEGVNEARRASAWLDETLRSLL